MYIKTMLLYIVVNNKLDEISDYKCSEKSEYEMMIFSESKYIK